MAYNTNQQPQRLWIIVGASSSMAKHFAREMALAHCPLLLIGREQADLESLASDMALRGSGEVNFLAGSIEDEALRQMIVQTAHNQPLPIGVMSVAGIMPDQDELQHSPALLAQMMSINLTSQMQLCTALLPVLCHKAGSMVILTGSVAGDRGRRKNYLYGAGKAGLAAFAQGLAAQLSDYAVPVLLLKPGLMDTSMTWGLKLPPLPLGQPAALAHLLAKRCASGKGGTLYYPWFWQPLMRLIRELPTKIFNKLNF